MNDRFIPKSQAQCDYANAMRDFEQAHKVWMNTPVHTAEGQRAKAEKDRTREIYLTAYRIANPTHIGM